MATTGPKTQTMQAKVMQPEPYTSLQTEQKLNRKTQRTINGQPEAVVRPKQSGMTEEP